MAKRRKMKKRQSKRLFSRTAQKVNRRNLQPKPMRGGYRL